MAQQQIQGTQILPGAVHDLEVNSAAAIQESKLLFDSSTGHDHDTVGKQNLAVQISKRLQVTATPVPNLFVHIAASPGLSFPQGTTPDVLAQAINFGTTLPLVPNLRVDLIYLDSSGLVQIRQGVAVPSSPVPPSHEGVLPIAEVGPLASGTTAITQSLIKDVRPFLGTNPVVRIQDHGGSSAYASTINITGSLTSTVSSGVATISASTPTVPDASTSTMGIAKLSVAPVSSTNPIALGANDPAVALISTAVQKDGSVVYTADQNFGGHNIANAGSAALSNGLQLTGGGAITTTSAGNMDLAPAVNGKVRCTSTNTALMLPNIPGAASFGNLGDVWYDSSADSFVGRKVAGPTIFTMTSPVPATTSVLGIVEVSVAPVSSGTPIAVGDNDPRVPTQPENDALAGTNGSPSSSNKYLTNSDPRVPSTNEKAALAGTAGAGPSSGNKYVLVDYTNLPTTNEKAAFAGTAGTPSGVNQFVTTTDTRIPTASQALALVGVGTAAASGTNKYVLQDYSLLPISGEKSALAGSAGTPGSANKYVTQTDPLIPTGTQSQALVGSSGTPSSSNRYVTMLDPILPTAAMKAALAGSAGSPSDTNRYVTAQDSSYILRDGTRAFVNPVSGVSPIIPSHLATRGYVDTVAAAAANGAVGLSVESLSALSAIPSGQRIDNQLILVENGDNSGLGVIYYFDLQSEGGGVAPNEGPGVWYPVTAPATQHNTLSGLQGGTTGQYFHLTSAQTTGLTGGGVTSLHNHSHSALTNLSADDHTQYSRVDGTRAFTGVVSGQTPTTSSHLTTKAYVDGRTPDASTSVKGVIKVSVAPASPTNPIAFGVNDGNVFLADGSITCTDSINLGTNNIQNVGTVTALDLQGSTTFPSFGSYHMSLQPEFQLLTAKTFVFKTTGAYSPTYFEIRNPSNDAVLRANTAGGVDILGFNIETIGALDFTVGSPTFSAAASIFYRSGDQNLVFTTSGTPIGYIMQLPDSGGLTSFTVTNATTDALFSVNSDGRIDALLNPIENVAAPTASGDAVNKGYADGLLTGVVLTDGTHPLTGDWDVGQHEIDNASRVQTNQVALFSNAINGLSATFQTANSLNAIALFCSPPPDTTGLSIILGDTAGASYFKVADSNATTLFSIDSLGTTDLHGHDITNVANLSVRTFPPSLTLFQSAADSSAITANSATNFSTSYTIPAGELNVVSRNFEVDAYGIYSSSGSPGTNTLTLLIGSNSGLANNPITLPSAQTNSSWHVHFNIVVRSNGATGTGRYRVKNSFFDSTGMEFTSGNGGSFSSFDWTGSPVIALQNTFSTTGNSITIHSMTIKEYN